MKLIPSGLTRQVATQVYRVKRNSPHIFFAAGVVGTVGSTVLACRATLKLEEVLDDFQAELKDFNEQSDAAVETEKLNYTEKDQTKDRVVIYTKGAVELGKLYGPAIGVGVVSIAMLTGSHVQLTRRNAALATTLGVVSKAYEEYRERVRQTIGDERELDIYRGVESEAHTIDGKVQKVDIAHPGPWSPYARVFDETSTQWIKNAEHNKTFLMHQQNYFNHLLMARGHVFLNEVYDALGFERTTAGQIVGWLYEGEGDRHIDFGLFEAHAHRFVNGIERSVFLDFNVDGPIHDKI